MLGALRAELLVLRKWRAAWALLLITPLLTLVTNYGLPYLQYLTVTPDQYSAVGTPSQILPTILPSQFVIVVAGNFGFTGTAPFVVLGAVLAGGDWGRGTIKTSLLQAPGRLRSFAGQALALAFALAASVLLTFAVAAAASLLIARFEAAAVSPLDGALPAGSVLARGVAVGLLIGLCYGAAGIALGTIFGNIGAAIAAALLWTVVGQAVLDNLALQAGGVLQTINDVLPNASAVSITSTFGAVGGGADASLYYRVAPALSVWVLLGYTAGFLVLAAVLLRRRDIGVGGISRVRRRRLRSRVPDEQVIEGYEDEPLDSIGGVLASLRAELLVMCRRPAVWAFVLVMPVYTLLNSYLVQYVFYRTAGSGVFADLVPDQILPNILPAQFMTVSLNSFGFTMGLDGTAAFVLLGAVLAGSSWGDGTVKTALLQCPGRLQTALGQALALLVAVTVSVLATVVVAAAASTVVALVQTGSVSPALGPFPSLATVAQGVAGALLVGFAYGAAGLTLGTVFRNAGGAIAAALLWSVILRSVLDNLAQQLHGGLQTINKVLPNASTTTLTHLFNPIGASPGVQLDTRTAAVVLSLYAMAFLAVPAVLMRSRDVG
jgi:ABC-2 type transport system permease protein